MTQSQDSPRRRSVRFQEEEQEEDASPTSMDKSTASSQSTLSRRLMRQHVKDRDPLFYYEICNIVGVGSMGSVAVVSKREEAIGGSSRKEIVETFRRHQRQERCFHTPLLGPLFRFCIEDIGICGKKKKTIHTKSDSESSSISFISSLTASKRDLFTASERSAVSSIEDEESHRSIHEMKYAMKSIHLNRITDETFINELQNEIEILKQLDHPHIVRLIETFNHRNQVFMVMELCTGGDLYTRDPYTEEEAARIISSVLSAVSYMHLKGIVHRCDRHLF
jgi:serine/threonine protein kinase